MPLACPVGRAAHLPLGSADSPGIHFPGPEGIKTRGGVRSRVALGPAGEALIVSLVTIAVTHNSRQVYFYSPRLIFSLAFLIGGNFWSGSRKVWLMKDRALWPNLPGTPSFPERWALTFSGTQGSRWAQRRGKPLFYFGGKSAQA